MDAFPAVESGDRRAIDASQRRAKPSPPRPARREVRRTAQRLSEPPQPIAIPLSRCRRRRDRAHGGTPKRGVNLNIIGPIPHTRFRICDIVARFQSIEPAAEVKDPSGSSPCVPPDLGGVIATARHRSAERTAPSEERVRGVTTPTARSRMAGRVSNAHVEHGRADGCDRSRDGRRACEGGPTSKPLHKIPPRSRRNPNRT